MGRMRTAVIFYYNGVEHTHPQHKIMQDAPTAA